jgi:hypothetical protein
MKPNVSVQPSPLHAHARRPGAARFGLLSGPIPAIAVLWLTAGGHRRRGQAAQYPTIFNSADVAVVSKTDLAAAAGFDWDLSSGNIQAVRPGMPIVRVSARPGEGMDAFTGLLEARLAELRAPVEATAT